MSGHALLSPSSAYRWLNCPGSVVLSKDISQGRSSIYADEGTAAHFLAEQCFNNTYQAERYLGDIIVVTDEGNAEWFNGQEIPEDWNNFEVDEEMAEYVQLYMDSVESFVGDGEMFIEQRLSISSITGEEDAYGTSDVVAIVGKELQVHDLKYGKGRQVFAKDNPQLKIYALAALEAYELLYDIETIRWFIHQPRLDHMDDDSCSVEELRRWGEWVSYTADYIDGLLLGSTPNEATFVPGDEQCQWCPAKPCTAYTQRVANTVADDFVDLATLPELNPVLAEGLDSSLLKGCYQAIPLIRQWCDAIETRMQDEVSQGLQPDYKMVAGRKGARAWDDTDEVTKMLKSMRFKNDQMYDQKLISPASAEKLLKGQEKRWSKLQAHIVQKDGKPTVAPIDDKRPAIGAGADEFDNVNEDTDQ